MPFRFCLSDFGSTFSTRPRGIELRDTLVQKAGHEVEVEVDLEGVLSVSYSFADEFAAGLVQGSTDGSIPFAVHLIGASSEVERVIDRAIAHRQSLASTNIRAAAAMA
jgi:STAS-like domain of unknown function (DUF4325)